MSDRTIIGAVHRHDGKSGLVIRVGQPPPSHYQRPTSVVVKAIAIESPHHPVECRLSDGGTICIAPSAVEEFIYA